MDYVFSSTNNETILVSPNNESANIDSNGGRLRDEDVCNLFGQFPSPFLLDDDMIALQHHQHNTNNNLGNMHSDDRWKTLSADDDEQTHDQKSADCKTTTTTKRVRKKRSAGKKDRHSKIHTAQGLRDRRMRLSLHIARKFFGLQDILGFDKASKTIEWLFSKSKKAIDQVTEEAAAGGQQLNNNNNKSPPQNTTQSVSYNYKEHMDLQEDQSAAANYLSDNDCEVDSGIDNQLNVAASNKGKQLMKIHDYIADEMKDSIGKKAAAAATERDHQAILREYSSSRDKARARARERTRDKRLMMINSTLQKSKQATNPAAANDEDEEEDVDDFELGLLSNNNNNHYMMEESSTSHPLDQYSAAAGGGTRHHHHLYDQISSSQLILEQRSTGQEDHNLGSAAAAAGSSSTNYYYYSGYNNNNNYYNGSYMMNKNFVNPPPAGWLNSSNTFLGFLGGGWDDDSHENSNFTENNYGGSLHVPNHLDPSSTGTCTGDDNNNNNNNIHGQNFVIPAPSPTNILQHFQTQNQRE